MALKVLFGFIAIIALCLGISFLKLCKALVIKYASKLREPEDEEDGLTDEEKYKRYLEKKHRELAKERGATQLHDKSVEEELEYKSAVKIVGLIEPIGRWTRFVMSERRQGMVGMKPENVRNGFWQMLVSMKGMYQGKYKGRSR